MIDLNERNAALGDQLETMVAAVDDVIDGRSSTFRARNGRNVGIKDDNGEKCWIVPSDEMFALESALAEFKTSNVRYRKSFQNRVAPWMEACFGPEISSDRLERGDRLLEEVLELLQSGDYPVDRVAALTDYVFERDKGEPHQEVGGVMVTLAAYCMAHGLDMHHAGEDELARIWTKVEEIRAKQAAKPTGSALPVAVK
ncbi:hypothetical protein [Notoacmeibacter sp. MSK16QG-6]|uniref:hypothetical protein n=1 Tax=Notoacmeibacter sp. MSK16QG-6 TaxID=2957982 RepID=UPI00209EBC5B|nr:hypothetical protein [Notoacmeibacter sp. MSK16QG-6]MCP1200094.1 hypothetical protein [Notoacmeibacter sp. MSK16QG-6]